MRQSLIAPRSLTALLILGLCASAVPAWAASDLKARSEAKLARALEGRVPGKPVDCLNQYDIRSSRIIARTAILYETNNGTLYVNRPDNGSRSLSEGDVLVTDTHSHRLCRIDVVQLYDTTSRMRTGSIFLGPFVPYRKDGRPR
jgi:hypothetical protein